MIISLGRIVAALIMVSSCQSVLRTVGCLSPLETPFSQGGICLLSLDFVMLPAQYLGVSQCRVRVLVCVCVPVCECNSAYNYNIYLVNSFYIFISISLSLFHIFIAIFLFLFAAHIGDYFPALNEFSTHTVIRPKVQHGRTRRALQSTLDATVSGSCATAMSCKVKMKGKQGTRES